MSIEKYQDLLQEGSRLRSISIAPGSPFQVGPLDAPGLALDVRVDPALLLAADCRRFGATTVPIPVALPASECLALIDPARWEEFSDIGITEVKKTEDRGANGWTGSIREVVIIRWNGKDYRYVNVLKIDFRVGPTSCVVNFELEKALEGGLAFEIGYLRLDPSPFGMLLTSHKELQYQGDSEWCKVPLRKLEFILGTWLNAAAFQYAFRMVKAARQPLVPDVFDKSLQSLQAMRRLAELSLS